MLAIVTAALDCVSDNGEWTINQAGNLDPASEFVQAISPFYIKICPVVDQWGEPFKVYVGSQAAVRAIAPEDVGPDDVVIESYGRDGISDGWAYDPADPSHDYYTVDSMRAFRLDMVNWNGGWIRAPRVALPPNN